MNAETARQRQKLKGPDSSSTARSCIPQTKIIHHPLFFYKYQAKIAYPLALIPRGASPSRAPRRAPLASTTAARLSARAAARPRLRPRRRRAGACRWATDPTGGSRARSPRSSLGRRGRWRERPVGSDPTTRRCLRTSPRWGRDARAAPRATGGKTRSVVSKTLALLSKQRIVYALLKVS